MGSGAGVATYRVDSVQATLLAEAAEGPQKATKRPQDLRPIVLQSAAAKAVTTVFRWRLTDSSHAIIRDTPQYAYVACRSTVEAISRVASHCSQVRSMLKEQALGTHARFRRGSESRLPWGCATDLGFIQGI